MLIHLQHLTSHIKNKVWVTDCSEVMKAFSHILACLESFLHFRPWVHSWSTESAISESDNYVQRGKQLCTTPVLKPVPHLHVPPLPLSAQLNWWLRRQGLIACTVSISMSCVPHAVKAPSSFQPYGTIFCFHAALELLIWESHLPEVLLGLTWLRCKVRAKWVISKHHSSLKHEDAEFNSNAWLVLWRFCHPRLVITHRSSLGVANDVDNSKDPRLNLAQGKPPPKHKTHIVPFLCLSWTETPR